MQTVRNISSNGNYKNMPTKYFVEFLLISYIKYSSYGELHIML